MPQKLAAQADLSVNIEVHDKPTRDLTQQLMGRSGPEWNAQDKAQALTLLASPAQRSHEKLLLMGNVVARHRLLDVIVQSLWTPTDAKPLVVPRAPRPHHTARRMDRVRFWFCSSPLFAHVNPS